MLRRTWCVIRDPVDRFVSQHGDAVNTRSHVDHLRLDCSPASLNWHATRVRRLASDTVHFCHYVRQALYPCDFLVAYERIKTGVPRLLRELSNISVVVPASHVNPSACQLSRANLTLENLREIADVYSDDVELHARALAHGFQ